MATLNESGTWPAGIYQLETTDPVLGGAPNEATGAGMSNIPHQQLARRTQVLKTLVDGAGVGATAVPLVTLNSAAARVTGSYRFASGDANTPLTGAAGTVQVIAASASAVNQIACDSASTRTWARFWNGTVWSAWSEFWQSSGVISSLGVSGWQRLPSGLILQWGLASTTTNPISVTLPIAFPNAHLAALASETGGGLVRFGANPLSLTQVQLFTSDTTFGVCRFLCLGR